MATSTMPAGVAASLLADPDLCTLSTCPMSLANLDYVPSLAGNAFYVAIFALLLVMQVFLGVRYRTWGFMAGMIGGTLLECLGYLGRIQMHSNPFTQGPFLMYLVTLTIGPAFLSASIYTCLSRIVVTYSEGISRFKPRTYTVAFVACDFIALLLQAVGGAIASIADDESTTQMGINIMIAGVSWQLVCLGAFAGVCCDYAIRVRRSNVESLNPDFAIMRQSIKFRGFLCGLVVATVTIFVRSIFRCAELSGGFDGALANNQITFMILEGAMIICAVTAMTICHPGVGFQGQFSQTGWHLRTKKTATRTSKGPLSSSSESVTMQSEHENKVSALV